MIDPYKGVLLNGRYYGYVSDTFSEVVGIKNSVIENQTNRSGSILGIQPSDFTVTLSLDNTYNVYAGSSVVGETTWLGVSRLTDLKSYIGGLGSSQPLTFIVPYGATYQVIPTGQLTVTIFNPENPSEDGTEFRVSLSLSTIQ